MFLLLSGSRGAHLGREEGTGQRSMWCSGARARGERTLHKAPDSINRRDSPGRSTALIPA